MILLQVSLLTVLREMTVPIVTPGCGLSLLNTKFEMLEINGFFLSVKS